MNIVGLELTEAVEVASGCDPLAINTDQARLEGSAFGRFEETVQVPVRRALVGDSLALALDNDAGGYGLDAAGGA